MVVKTNFSSQDFNQILTKYDLGKIISSEPVSQGTVQTNYLIKTTQGRYVLRYFENRTKESVLFECSLLTFLNKHKYPSPNPFKTKQGDCVGSHLGKPFMILEFIEGEHIENLTNQHKQQLVEKVAALQVLTQGYQPLHNVSRWNYDIDLCQKLAKAEAHKLGTKDASRKLLWLKSHLIELDLPNSLPKGICHCDFHFSNVLFLGENLVGIIDFDDANYTYLTFDLVCLVDSWAWPFQSENLDFVQAREIVLEYQKHRLLNTLEQRHLIDVHKLSILFDCIWYFGRGSVDDFYERKKIEFLNALGREEYADAFFSK